MAKIYSPADGEVEARGNTMLKLYHEELGAVGLKIDYIFIRSDKEGEHALKHQGYNAAAVVRIINQKDRTMGRGDAEIVIEYDDWAGMDDDQRDALLDHELFHLRLAKDAEGGIKRDDLNRPLLKMRKHDHQFGWFVDVAVRHGRAAMEVRQAKRMFDDYGQAYWPQLMGEVKTIEATGSKLTSEDTQVTISAGGKSVAMTGEQLAKAAQNISKRSK